ncbi:phosphoribosyl-ATP diphosphatase [Enterococcus plantarum]|uniref:Phosphoribosyl-ATP diphosphatase n=1 Tax=Enterococcus plantarum TaxID=1077675 RepID=A0A2W4BHM8_9ENTE|nr:phosphoribosyl-ATP diphosphatase [Enterococcus plantarum]PZL71709.1 phosphoribosyl-ATP diphosphatase [Enterococcus plantarum]
MKIKVKKIDGEAFTAETDKTLDEIFEELSNTSENSFILLGEHIEQKMTIQSIEKE